MKPTIRLRQFLLGAAFLPATGRGAVLLNLQHSSDLGVSDLWASALVPGAIGEFTFSHVDFDVTDPGGPLHVVATVQASQASLGKLFGRLRATE